MNLEKEVQQAIVLLHEHPSARNKAIVSECLGLLDDIYSEIQQQIMDDCIKFDLSVTIKVDGKNVKFQNENYFVEWLHGIID